MLQQERIVANNLCKGRYRPIRLASEKRWVCTITGSHSNSGVNWRREIVYNTPSWSTEGNCYNAQQVCVQLGFLTLFTSSNRVCALLFRGQTQWKMGWGFHGFSCIHDAIHEYLLPCDWDFTNLGAKVSLLVKHLKLDWHDLYNYECFVRCTKHNVLWRPYYQPVN